MSVAVALALGVAAEAPTERTPEELLLLTALGDGALLLAIAAVGRPLLGLRPADLGLRRPSAASLRLAALAAAGLWIVSIVVNIAQISLFGPHPQSLIVTVGTHTGPLAFATDLVAAAVVAPFAEEILFRGLIFGGLAQRAPFPVAASVSALLFAASHGLGVIAPIFVLGLGLAYLYSRTGTIWPSMLAHAIVNAVSLAFVFALPR